MSKHNTQSTFSTEELHNGIIQWFGAVFAENPDLKQQFVSENLNLVTALITTQKEGLGDTLSTLQQLYKIAKLPICAIDTSMLHDTIRHSSVMQAKDPLQAIIEEFKDIYLSTSAKKSRNPTQRFLNDDRVDQIIDEHHNLSAILKNPLLRQQLIQNTNADIVGSIQELISAAHADDAPSTTDTHSQPTKTFTEAELQEGITTWYSIAFGDGNQKILKQQFVLRNTSLVKVLINTHSEMLGDTLPELILLSQLPESRELFTTPHQSRYIETSMNPQAVRSKIKPLTTKESLSIAIQPTTKKPTPSIEKALLTEYQTQLSVFEDTTQAIKSLVQAAYVLLELMEQRNILDPKQAQGFLVQSLTITSDQAEELDKINAKKPGTPKHAATVQQIKNMAQNIGITNTLDILHFINSLEHQIHFTTKENLIESSNLLAKHLKEHKNLVVEYNKILEKFEHDLEISTDSENHNVIFYAIAKLRAIKVVLYNGKYTPTQTEQDWREVITTDQKGNTSFIIVLLSADPTLPMKDLDTLLELTNSVYVMHDNDKTPTQSAPTTGRATPTEVIDFDQSNEIVPLQFPKSRNYAPEPNETDIYHQLAHDIPPYDSRYTELSYSTEPLHAQYNTVVIGSDASVTVFPPNGDSII